MSSPEHALAVETATRRLLRVALLFGLGGSIVALVTTVQHRPAAGSVAVGTAWCAAWAAGAVRPEAVAWLLLRWRWTTPLVAAASVGTILASDGLDSLLKTEANWLAWAAPVVLGTAASLAIAAILSTGLLTAMLLGGRSLHDIIAGPDRYTAVTDLVNPFVIVLVALAFTGVFRVILRGAATTLASARGGGPTSTPGMSQLLAGRPARALPAGAFAPDSAPDMTIDPREPATALSQAEREIIELLADGRTPQQIALQRERSVETVYDQIASAKHKAGARTIEHLIARAWRPPN